MTAAAAAAVLFVVGVLAVISRNGEDVPTGPASAPTVAAPLATLEVVDPIPAPGFVDSAENRWSRVPHSEEFFGEGFEQGMHSVTVEGPGLVAVGGADGGAAVWTSPDGITWSRTPGHETIFEGAVMSGVTAGGPGLVAVGTEWEDGFTDSDAAVWTSVDGLTWARVPHDEAIFGNTTGAWMWSVAAGGPGLSEQI